MSENPFQSPDSTDERTRSASRLDRFRGRMKAFFRVASVIFGLLTVAGAINGAYYVWQDLERGGTNPFSLSMLFGALITGVCAGMLFWISKRL